MLKIGLTGNIASGKTQVENIVAKSGFLVIDLDDVSHELLDNNTKVQKQILKEFNTPDRKQLAKIVFNDENKKNVLEKIIHPCLRAFILELFDKNKNEKAVFVSGALIYEANFDNLFDKIIYVNADYNLRFERLKKRNNFDDLQAEKRMKFQKDNKTKADYIIENNSTLNELENNVKDILYQIFR